MGFYYDLFEDAMEKLAYEEEIAFEMEKQAGRLEDAGRWTDEQVARGTAAAGRGWKKTKDAVRAGYGKVRGAAGAVGRHLKRQKGRYGKAGLLAGATAGGYAYGRKDR